VDGSRITETSEVMKKVRTLNLSNSNRRTIKAGMQMADSLLKFACGGESRALATALIELVNLEYLDDNALQTLFGLVKGLSRSRFRGLLEELQKEYRSRLRKWVKEGNKIRRK